MRLWALCYAAANRVPTAFMPDRIPLKKAVEIPVSAFLPSEEDTAEIKEFHIRKALAEHLPTFHCLRKTQPSFIKHQYWPQMAQKSEIINLGVVDENPSTNVGAIGIMDYLTEKVPLYPDGNPYPIVTHCDTGAFERMCGARRIRAVDRGPLKKLLGIEPSGQEFHKRGLMLQLIMDTYFHRASQSERGSLANIKVVMGYHSVKSKVMDCFNHVESMLDVVCDGYLVLFAMQLLCMESLDDEPAEIHDPNDIEAKERLLNFIAETIADEIWLQPSEEQLRSVADAIIDPGIKQAV